MAKPRPETDRVERQSGTARTTTPEVLLFARWRLNRPDNIRHTLRFRVSDSPGDWREKKNQMQDRESMVGKLSPVLAEADQNVWRPNTGVEAQPFGTWTELTLLMTLYSR